MSVPASVPALEGPHYRVVGMDYIELCPSKKLYTGMGSGSSDYMIKVDEEH